MKSFLTVQSKRTGLSRPKLEKIYQRASFNLFSDIETCPICHSCLLIDEYTVREIFHMEMHLRNIGWFLLEYNEFPTKEFNQDYPKILYISRDDDIRKHWSRLRHLPNYK